MSANTQTVRRYMEAYARWDHAEILACLTDDVEWVVPGAFHLEGIEAFDHEIEGEGAAGPPDIAITRLIEDGDIVVAEGTVRNALLDGGTLSLVYCDIFELRAGRVCKLTSYLMPVPNAEG